MAMRRSNRAGAAAVLAATLLVNGCAALGLGGVIQPPSMTPAEGQEAELRLALPSVNRPLGGATLRVWTRVQNPNAFGMTIAALAGNLFLEQERAAAVEFPLGLPLPARADTIIPLDLHINFADVPGLADAATRILTQNRVAYRLDGTLTVDAGALGQPSFGPSTWLRGESRVIR
jgi:hypothetical protein